MWTDPMSELGRVERSLQSEIRQKANSHEVHSLRSNVDGLERTVRDLRSEIDGLRSELAKLREALPGDPQ